MYRFLDIIRMMKTFFIIILFFLAINVSAKTFKFCFEENTYLPFVNSNTTVSGTRGFLVDTIEKVLKDMGHEVEFYSFPWKRCIRYVEENKFDGLFAAIWQSERDEWGVFPKIGDKEDPSRAMYLAKYKVFKNKKNPMSWDGIKFLHSKCQISAPLGYVAYKKLEKLDCIIKNSIDAKRGFELLQTNRIDGYIVEQKIGESFIKKLGAFDQIKMLDKIFIENNWYLPFSKKFYGENIKLVESFWKKLHVETNNEKSEIYKKYLELNH